MRLTIASLLTCLLLAAAQPARQPPAKTPAKSAAKTSAQKKTASQKSSSKKAASSKISSPSRRRAAAARRRPVRQNWRSGQMQPTPERYREIQQALIDRGHLQGPPTGAWGPESAEALKNFQREQNLPATGKLDALSLIALGLGPKRDTASATARPSAASPKH